MARSKNLKGALVSHKSLVARKQAEERNKAHKLAKQASMKTSSAERKAAKRAAVAKAERQSGQAGPTKSSHISNDEMKPISTSENNKGKSRAIPTSSKPVIPFDKTDTILLIGEANFSFALSLTTAPYHHPSHQILATSYDSREICFEKYPDAKMNFDELEKRGVKVAFGIDAMDLGRSRKIIGKGRKWSRVIFNFPHVGAGITDQTRNILSNQALLLRFLRSVNPLLTDGPSSFPVVQTKKGKKIIQLRGKANNKRKRSGSFDDDEDEDAVNAGNGGVEEDVSDIEIEDMEDGDEDLNVDDTRIDAKITVEREFDPPIKEGTVLITLLNQPPYTNWDLPKLATKPPSTSSTFSRLLYSSTPSLAKQGNRETEQPRYRLLRSFQFHPEVYKGYEHRRTIGFKEGVSKSGNEEILGRKGVARTWEFARAEEE